MTASAIAPSTVPGRDAVHVVKFYDDEQHMLSIVGDFLAEGAAAGTPLLVVARPPRAAAFAAELRAHGFDVDAMKSAALLEIVDAGDLLPRVMNGAFLDEERFARQIGDRIRHAVHTHGTVRAYGEMVELLWKEGHHDAAVRLERLWNDLSSRHPFSIFCAYPIASFVKESDRPLFDAICDQHTHVIPVDEPGDRAEGRRLIAALQQRTLALESEIQQRTQLETALCEALASRADTEAELRRLYELAQESNRAKDHFLATLSHELRTPLTAILGWARMLTMGGLDAETTRAAHETIERSARMQASIIDDLLDLARIVTGKLSLQRELVDLGSVVDEAVQTCRLAADAKQIDIGVVKELERVVVTGDPNRLRQIVWNLLSNAIKYSEPGLRVTLSVERVEREARLTVRDNGRGISSSFLPHVFEPFRQGNAASHRSEGGLGLGLAIVKHLTELHGGRIQAASDGIGEGSTFVVTLPVVHHVDKAGGDADLSDDVDLTGKRILIVEDDGPSSSLLCAVLRRFGASVAAAATGAKALELLRKTPTDVVVSDIMLGAESGFDLLPMIRRASPPTLVFAVTALSDAGADERLTAAGFDAVMRKPIDPVAFVRRLVEMVGAGECATV